MSQPFVNSFKGHPVLNLELDNGQPFSFGASKAALVVLHIALIRQFAAGSLTAVELVGNKECAIADFKGQPIFSIMSEGISRYPMSAFSFGKAKAQALVAGFQAIEQFASSQAAPPPAPDLEPGRGPAAPAARSKMVAWIAWQMMDGEKLDDLMTEVKAEIARLTAIRETLARDAKPVNTAPASAGGKTLDDLVLEHVPEAEREAAKAKLVAGQKQPASRSAKPRQSKAAPVSNNTAPENRAG